MFLARVLEFMETPQYLRRTLFERHPDLQSAGLLNPLDAPHHMRAHEKTPYREGVVTDKPPGTLPNTNGTKTGSFVFVGLKEHVLVDKCIKPGTRVTVKMNSYHKGQRKCESHTRARVHVHRRRH